MPDKTEGAEAQPTESAFGPAEGFPPQDLPTIFADMVANVAPTSSNIRMYLLRSDSDVSGANRVRNVPVAQIIMPVEGFVNMAVFLNQAVDKLVNVGLINREQVDWQRQQLHGPAER